MLKFISSLFIQGETVAVAVSGGADSMSLLYALKDNEKKLKINVIAVNVEHGIRGQASVSDSDFVKSYCAENNIPLKTFTVNAPLYAKSNKISVEQAARILRYDCFNQMLKNGECDKIATAHHASDNAETILLNLFRGTGLKGIAGIKPQNVKYIRPLLYTEKSEILSYVSENKIPFVTDETNFDHDITRNYLRLKIIPEIKNIFPDAERSITKLSTTAIEEDAFLDELATSLVEKTNGIIKVKLTEQPVLMRRAIIIAMKLSGITKDYESAHVITTANLVNLKNGSKVSLPNGVTAIKEYDCLAFYVENTSAFNPIKFACGEYIFPHGLLKIEKAEKYIDLKNGFYCDSDKLPDDTVIRTRENGDIFTKFGGKTKKLKNFFIDEKIPQRLRDGLPIIASKKQVFFNGLAISDKIKVDKSTINVIKLTYIESEGEKD